jgi:hypothetical protein
MFWLAVFFPDAPPVEVDHFVSEGAADLLPGDLRAIDTPGHTPGHTSYLLDRAGGVLFVGDAAVATKDGRVKRGSSNRSTPEIDGSLRHLAEFEFAFAAFSHSQPIPTRASGAFQRFAEALTSPRRPIRTHGETETKGSADRRASGEPGADAGARAARPQGKAADDIRTFAVAEDLGYREAVEIATDRLTATYAARVGGGAMSAVVSEDEHSGHTLFAAARAARATSVALPQRLARRRGMAYPHRALRRAGRDHTTTGGVTNRAA